MVSDSSGGSDDERRASGAPSPEGEEATVPDTALAALAILARLHHIAADPKALRHQLGLGEHSPCRRQDLLFAARHLGLKAKTVRSSADRLSLVPLPALAFMNDGRVLVLAQCDGQRVLFLDPASDSSSAKQSVAGAGAAGGDSPARPIIEPLEVFAQHWSGELVLLSSRASLAGTLARFDFSWFIPSIVKHRRLLGEVLLISLFLQLFALVSPLFF
jgi:subfamily B ATP-binding cassette protein HlyB/CyaB